MKRAKITEELAYGSALDRLTGGEKTASKADTPKAAPAPAAQPAKLEMIKLSVFLNREEDAFLEALASTAKFSGGKKLSKTKLIEAMVRAFRKTNLDVRGVNDYQELQSRIAAQMQM
ncbi:MAG: hypothetical protein PHG35_07905 [Dehalococcoidales bacterium]|nr:hypothetical protein [Dehalococcoidales bacterium]